MMEVMNVAGFAIVFTLAGAVLFFVILYHVIRAAVRGGIMDAHSESSGETENGLGISQIECPHCGKSYDIDYPKCPHCN